MRRLYDLLLALLTAALLAAWVRAGITSPGPITVRASATIAGRTIRLADVSNATGTLGAITLGAAPLPGRSCVVTLGEIRLRLRAAGVPLDRVRIAGPVTITATGGALPSDALTTVAIAALRKALPWPEGDLIIEPAGTPTLPTFRGDAQPKLAAGTPVVRSFRSAVVPVTVTLPGEAPQTVQVALRVRVTTDAMVAARSISPRAVLGPDDVTVARVELSGPEYLTDAASLIGKRANRALLPGRAITNADVETAPVIAPNAAVTVLARFGAVEVSAAGIAREEGCAGQTIRVRLTPEPGQPGASREVRARVVDAQTVVIEE